jgi:hypothetical protein
MYIAEALSVSHARLLNGIQLKAPLASSSNNLANQSLWCRRPCQLARWDAVDECKSAIILYRLLAAQAKQPCKQQEASKRKDVA